MSVPPNGEPSIGAEISNVSNSVYTVSTDVTNTVYVKFNNPTSINTPYYVELKRVSLAICLTIK